MHRMAIAITCRTESTASISETDSTVTSKLDSIEVCGPMNAETSDLECVATGRLDCVAAGRLDCVTASRLEHIVASGLRSLGCLLLTPTSAVGQSDWKPASNTCGITGCLQMQHLQ